ncbi:Alpha-crystallin B chain [Halotydeus destructor]|nr:Alpha-crystallin B chain [Halotydeus destructor]
MSCKVDCPMFTDDMIKSMGGFGSLFEDAAAWQQLGQQRSCPRGRHFGPRRTHVQWPGFGRNHGQFLENLVGQFFEAMEVDETKGKDTFNLTVDVAGYLPEELKVTVADGFITVSGNREKSSEDNAESESFQFSRRVKLPENVNVEAISSTMSKDKTTLTISAPLLVKQGPEQVVPIEVKKPEPSNQSVSANDQ